jgi:hypothetical protein
MRLIERILDFLFPRPAPVPVPVRVRKPRR